MIALAQVKPWIPSSATLRHYVIAKLRSLGLSPEIMPFRTFLSSGENVIVDICRQEDGSAGPRRLIGAHYDCCELYDNLGSVLCLIEAAASLYHGNTRHAWRIVFWDAEECFQQGSNAYLARGSVLTHSTKGGVEHSECLKHDGVYVDVDGMGVGPCLFARQIVQNTSNSRLSNSRFLLDADVFFRHGIPSFHIFSGPRSFREIYARDGLLGCHLALCENELATFQNWRRAMPLCRQSIMKLVAAWEELSLLDALHETGVICLTTI